MGLFSKKPTLVVHDGQFHADDIFAAAVLRIALGGKLKIVRTREQKLIDAADYVADVGGVYDPALKRFDHHQKGGAGSRTNGIPYASFGLAWKEYGEQICGSKEVAQRIDERLACPIDAEDNGMTLVQPLHGVSQYTLQGFLYLKRPTWKEGKEMYDTSFLSLVSEAEKILLREIEITKHYLEARDAVRTAYHAAPDKRLIELDKSYPYQEALSEFPEPLYVVFPRPNDGHWKIESVRKIPTAFENRKSLPESWAGLRDEELRAATGVPGAIFCHNGRWLCVANTRQDVLKLAEIALAA